MEKNTLSKILISVIMVGIFLLPISPSLEIKNNEQIILGTHAIKVLAVDNCEIESATFTPSGEQSKTWYTDANPPTFDIKIITKNCTPKDDLEVSLVENDMGPDDDLATMDDTIYNIESTDKQIIEIPNNKAGETDCEVLTGCDLYLKIDLVGWNNNYSSLGKDNGELEYACDGTCLGGETEVGEATKGSAELNLNCGITNLSGCLAQIFYAFFEIAAFVGKLAAWFLDFFVYYSTSSDSYVSEFITKGWGAVRDIANIFFIIALLYIAIKMILSLGDSHSKKLIGTIVIVALLINFSLFFTRVIIDGSNILAKVFYNNITITNQDSKTGATGEKSVSVALISKFNPQKLVTQKIYDGDHGVAMFIFITLIAMCVVLYAAYIFFSVGVLFVSRVVMLWISMIFAPIAFISYTLPFEIPGLGHKDWWKELLQNAFLAPIFIFFLYIITMFTDFLKDIVKFPDGADIMQKIMAVIIPFAILTILLMKAKEMAVKYAGEMGAAMQKAGAMVGGLAVGAATGGAAMLGRGTVGRLGSVIGRSETLKDAEKKGGLTGFMAARLRDTGNAAGKGSFDARGVKIAGKSLASTGLQVGSAQTGGFEKRRADQVAKRQQRADSLKLGEDSKEKQNLYKTDADLHGLNAEIEKEMEGIDKLIERKRQEAADAERELKAAEGNPEESAKAKVNLTRKNNQLKEAKERKDALRAGKEYTYIDDAGEEQIQKAHTSHNGMNLAQLETQKKDQLKDITKIDNERMHTYAESQASAGAQTLDFITSMGQHSFRGAREAENKIKTGAKAPASSGGGGGHGGGGDSHGGGEHPPKKEPAPPKDTHKDEHGGGGDHGHGK